MRRTLVQLLHLKMKRQKRAIWLQNSDRGYVEIVVMDFVQEITMYRRDIDWCAFNEFNFLKLPKNISPSLEYSVH